MYIYDTGMYDYMTEHRCVSYTGYTCVSIRGVESMSMHIGIYTYMDVFPLCVSTACVCIYTSVYTCICQYASYLCRYICVSLYIYHVSIYSYSFVLCFIYVSDSISRAQHISYACYALSYICMYVRVGPMCNDV